MFNKSKYFFASCIILIVFSGCLNSNKKVVRLQHLEEGVGSPVTVEELEAAIDKYSERVEDITAANAQIGIWYKMVGNRYLEKQMYGEALKNFQKAIEFYPQNQNLYYWVGVCAGYVAKSCLDYNGAGENKKRDAYYKLSEDSYLMALQIEPTYVRALYGLSILYAMELNESEKAVPYLEKLITIDKKHSDAMLLLARCYYVDSEFDKAIDIYDRIIKESRSQKAKETATENKKIVLEKSYE